MTRWCLFAALLGRSLQGQSVITTIAGADYVFPRNPAPALQSPLGQLDKVVQTHDGAVLVADEDNNVVVKIDSTGTLSVFAGNGLLNDSGDGGAATQASIAGPFGLAFNSTGDLYITERYGCLRKVNPAGIISNVSCNVAAPFGVAVDSKDNVYVASVGLSQILKITPAGKLTVAAGNGSSGFDDGVPATTARLNSPLAIAIDSQDNIYFTEPLNNRVREILPSGKLITFAGGGTRPPEGVQATAAALTPLDLAFYNGDLYITDQYYGVLKISGGVIKRVAGNTNTGYSGAHVPPLLASFALPGGLSITNSGNIYVTDRGAHRLRYVDFGANLISTIAGNGRFRFSNDGGQAVDSIIATPDGIVRDNAGNILFSEDLANRIRKLSPDGTLSTFAGTGDPGSNGDGGPATAAQISEPSGLALDSQGNLYIVDSTSARIRRVDLAGIITTIAGNGQNGFGGDGGDATAAQLGIPTGVGVGPDGSVYIADPQNRRVRRVSAGVITTFAGNGNPESSGDGGLAANAGTLYPFDVTVDRTGVVYISDNDRIRRVGQDGIISTFVSPDVIGSNSPGRLITDSANNVWASIGDRIIMFAPNGTPTLIAGNGKSGFGGDGGPPTQASFNCSCGIALDPSGLVYISDQGDNRVRLILPSAPTLTVSSQTLNLNGDSTGAPARGSSLTVNSSIPGVAFTTSAIADQGGTWLTVTPNRATTPASIQISGDPSQLAPGIYGGTVSIASDFTGTPPVLVRVTFSVSPAQPANLAVNSVSLSFSFLQNAPASAQTLFVSNSGDGSFNFKTGVSTDSGESWLSVAPATGSVTAGLDFAIAVTANPGALPPGTYTGSISVSNTANPGQTGIVRVAMIVSPIQRTLLLSQYGFTFTALAGGPQVPPQTFGVLNTGQGMMSWTAKALPSQSGAQWLSVSPASGTTDAASLAVPFVQVSVNTTALQSGIYYGQVVVQAPDAGNSPQVVSVVLNLLPAGSNPGLLVRPTGLIFTSVSGQIPGSQQIAVTNLSNTPVTFISGHLPVDPDNWFEEDLTNGTFQPGVTFSIQIVPIKPLPVGLTRGTLTIQPNDTHFSQQVVDLLQLVIPPSSQPSIGRLANSTCSPSPLILTFSQATAYNVVAGWPNALTVQVVDSCGEPLTSGNVTVSFSNGDPPLELASLKDGTWSQSWTPGRPASLVTLTATAVATDPSVTGTTTYTVYGVVPNTDPPIVNPGSIVSTADPSLTGAPIAPGSVISIIGTNFASGSVTVPNPPFDTQLDHTTVLLGGSALPISAVNPQEIDAIVPFDVPFINQTQQIVIQRDSSYSSPQSVTVSSAQPVIYSSNNKGSGQALIYRVAADGTETLSGAQTPAQPGDVIAIRCTGLGPIDQTLQAGLPAPNTPPAQATAQVMVQLGSLQIPATTAILVPGQAGVYEVQVTVPANVDTGPAVNIGIVVGGHASQSGVTVAIAGSTAPFISSVNTAYGPAAISPNDFIEIYGTGFATLVTGPSPLAAQLGGVSVTVNGKAALLYYVSPGQINALTPQDSATGSATVVVTSNGVPSAPFSVNVTSVTPSFLRLSDNANILATHADTSYVGPPSLGSAFTSASPGETLVAYAVGFGPSGPQSSALPSLPVCQIANLPLSVIYAGMTSAGLYQLNLMIPAGAPSGDNPISCTYAGSATTTGTLLSVQP